MPFEIYVTFPSLFIFSIILFHFKQLSGLRHCRKVRSISLPIALGTWLSIGMQTRYGAPKDLKIEARICKQ